MQMHMHMQQHQHQHQQRASAQRRQSAQQHMQQQQRHTSVLSQSHALAHGTGGWSAAAQRALAAANDDGAAAGSAGGNHVGHNADDGNGLGIRALGSNLLTVARTTSVDTRTVATAARGFFSLLPRLASHASPTRIVAAMAKEANESLLSHAATTAATTVANAPASIAHYELDMDADAASSRVHTNLEPFAPGGMTASWAGTASGRLTGGGGLGGGAPRATQLMAAEHDKLSAVRLTSMARPQAVPVPISMPPTEEALRVHNEMQISDAAAAAAAVLSRLPAPMPHDEQGAYVGADVHLSEDDDQSALDAAAAAAMLSPAAAAATERGRGRSTHPFEKDFLTPHTESHNRNLPRRAYDLDSGIAARQAAAAAAAASGYHDETFHPLPTRGHSRARAVEPRPRSQPPAPRHSQRAYLD